LTGRSAETDIQVQAAQRGYADWVGAGRGVRLWSESLRHGFYLGDEAFVERMKQGASSTAANADAVARDRGQA
jgi:hypothetical protein